MPSYQSIKIHEEFVERRMPQANLGGLLLVRHDRGAEYCDQPVCVCVCRSVREHISGTVGPIVTKFGVHIPCGRGLVVLRRRCDTLCTSGFMDDVTFGRNGPYGDSGDAIPGRSLMSMNVVLFLLLFFITPTGNKETQHTQTHAFNTTT